MRLTFPSEPSDRRTHANVHASEETDSASGGVSELLEEETATSAGFGLSESAFASDVAESDYSISNAVIGFAPPSVEYFDTTVEHTFPKTQSFSYMLGKRAFDLVFSVLAILISSPLMLLIAVAIKLTSRGPVFFLQDRVGQEGIFKMLKFRSMYVNDLSDTHHTTVGDPRITRVGALLRRSSFDELPQLFNVLKGEMSMVGPRPELVRFVDKFSREIPNYTARHIGKGGITGWAQVNGFRGSETSIAVRVEYDLEYLRNWNFWLDMKIILMTIYRGLFVNAF